MESDVEMSILNIYIPPEDGKGWSYVNLEEAHNKLNKLVSEYLYRVLLVVREDMYKHIKNMKINIIQIKIMWEHWYNLWNYIYKIIII